MKPAPMDSREAGLVLGQQLLGIDDLHYGLWENDIPLSIGNMAQAQQRYTDQLLACLPPPAEGVRILDIGCGTGHILEQCLKRGYHIDGVSPAPDLSRLVHQRLARHPGNDSRLFECLFENFPVAGNEHKYDAVFFSESFQYIPMAKAFELIEQILKPGGKVVICDFFKVPDVDPDTPGANTFGGGHDFNTFQKVLESIPFKVARDTDITTKVSPNIALLDDLLMNRIGPALGTIGQYFKGRRPFVFWLLTRPFRKKIDKLRHKYFSGHRSQQTFERFKTYHLIELIHQP